MMHPDSDEDTESHWKVERKIPLALIFAMLIQTGGALWWAASITGEVRSDREKFITFFTNQSILDKKQDEELQRMEARLAAQMEKIGDKIDRLMEQKRK